MNRLERASERYRKHHHSSRPRDFIFGADERTELFRRYVGGPGKRVLDVGCRYGALTRAYAVGNDVIGMDVDKDALERAAEIGITTVWGDAEEPLPFDDASFDIVVVGEILEHLREPERLIADASRVLRAGGNFVGSVPNAFRLKNRLRFLAGRHPETDPTHLHLFSPMDLRRLLGEFEHVRMHFVASRFLYVHPRLFGNGIVFRATKPIRRA